MEFAGFSYIPLLYTDTPLIDPEQLISKIDAHLKYLEDNSATHINGCIWAVNDGIAEPVLVMDYADDIYNHLTWWCSNKPEKYFQYTLVARNNTYQISITPNIRQSIARLKFNIGTIDSTMPTGDGPIFFIPLLFFSNRGDTLTQILNTPDITVPRVGDIARVHFVASRNVNATDPSNPIPDGSTIRTVTIPVTEPGELSDNMIREYELGNQEDT